jgi:glycosyltransferase involved in cell wall biosynthesis
MFKNITQKIIFILIWTSYALSVPLLQTSDDPDFTAKQTLSEEKTHLCLTMIVKNESQIIERCLNSVKNIVDCISICDTGSTDDTIERIEKFMQTHGIPGKVHRHTWQNFGHNRTQSVQAAQQILGELGFPLSRTYLLFLDADMLLQIEPSFVKNDLKDPSYLLLQKSSALSYYNTRLVRACLPWESVGVTHEYWSCKNLPSTAILQTLKIDDQEDGGCKTDKFERDVKLLTQGLKDEPDNARYMFYLAQSYKCLQQFNNAIEWYKARIEKGGWKEEVWYSKLAIGECYEDMGFWDQALYWYLDAYQYNPQRAESLQKIATYYRLKGQNHLAYIFAKQGSRIPYPKDQILFISHPIYHYQFDEEISIAAYYTPFKEEGFAAANRLALKKEVPLHIKEQNYKNLLLYVQNLKYSHLQPITIDLPFIREGMNQRYNPMNPSIQKTEDGYHLICRTVNFSQKGGIEYRSLDPLDATIRTRNFLIHYDQDFKLLSQREIIENLPREKVPSRIVGLEDCRLIPLNNNKWFFCTTYDTHPETIEQSLCKLEDNPSSSHEVQVEKLIPLQGTYDTTCEKNWLPFIKDDALYAIYGYEPFLIYKVNQENGSCEPIVQSTSSYDFSHFRGSAAPVEFDDGYLLMIHEVVWTEQRHYLHRFLYLDHDLNIKKLSKPFVFLHKGIEYCCGMTIDQANKRCMIPIGYEDRQAYLIFVDLDTIRSLLEPLP